MKDNHKKIKKWSCSSICLNYYMHIYDAILIFWLMNEITQLGIITLYMQKLPYPRDRAPSGLLPNKA